MDTLALVVMEQGSSWPRNIRDRVVDCVVLGQTLDEPGEAWVRRTSRRVQQLERQGRSVGVAALSCNGATGDGALEERTVIARSLLGAIRRAGGGVLFLIGSRKAPSVLRQGLLRVAEQLAEMLAGSSTSISVVFDGGP